MHRITAIRILSTLVALTLLLGSVSISPAHAQATGAYYTAREGDTLSSIARMFHTTTTSILSNNYLADPNVLVPGRRIRVPGFEDLTGEILRVDVPLGESFHSLARLQRPGVKVLERLNFITNPDSLTIGATYYKMKEDDISQTRLSLPAGVNALELAVKAQVNPWLAAEYNNLRGPWSLVQNDTIFLPGDKGIDLAASLPSFGGLTVSPSPILQGKTIVISAWTGKGSSLTGSLLDYPLHFFMDTNNQLVALQGIPRLAKPGVTPMLITSTASDGSIFTFQQNLILKKEDYGVDTPMQVADNFVDPAVTEPELAKVMEITAPATAEKMWSGAFKAPSPNPDHTTSVYGRLRSFNGSPYEYFHSGIDYGGNDETPILAPASGIVVYTGELTVRGNATIISHGWGVYTGYWHQSRIDVKVGDYVETGQRIGLVGETGRVTGPHLHFELIVGGVAVDPQDWLDGYYGSL